MTITRNQYLQLLGLLTVAKRHTELLDGIERAIIDIVGSDGKDHACDAIYGLMIEDVEQKVDALLDGLGITVEENPA